MVSINVCMGDTKKKGRRTTRNYLLSRLFILFEILFLDMPITDT